MPRLQQMLIGVLPVLFAGAVAAGNSPVVLGGSGQPPYFERTIDRIADALKVDGVNLKVLSGDANSRTATLDSMKEPGYSNLLYITLLRPRDGRSDPSRGKVVVECFVDSKKVWDETEKRPLIVPGSTEHQVDRMVDGIMKKIGKHVGGPCLSK